MWDFVPTILEEISSCPQVYIYFGEVVGVRFNIESHAADMVSYCCDCVLVYVAEKVIYACICVICGF